MSNPEIVAADVVVLLQYILKNPEGEVLDQSEGDDPLPYLHGHDNIVTGLENALDGLKVGDSRQVEVAPEEAYGPRDPGGAQPVPRDAFPPEAELLPGVSFMAEQDDGSMLPLWIESVSEEEVLVTTNHPLAGVTLHFDVTITGLRAASADEMAHGHPHGPDGTAGHHH